MADVEHAVKTLDRDYWTGQDLDAQNGETDGRIQNDRDLAYTQYAGHRGASLQYMVPRQLTSIEDSWGGALRRRQHGSVGPYRNDDVGLAAYASRRYVPVGFGAYTSPVIDLLEWRFYRLPGGMRLAVPITMSKQQVFTLVWRIYEYGPQSSGYVRHGDTYVPGLLGPGDRQALANTMPVLGSVSSKPYLNF